MNPAVGVPALAAVWRLARRDLRRTPLLTLLMMAMIALPVAATVGASILFATQTGTPAQRAEARMGQADLRLDDLGSPDGTAFTSDAVRALLPTGSRLEATGFEQATLSAGGGAFRLDLQAVDLDGLAEGMFPVLSGRAPAAPDEVALSTPALVAGALVVGDRADLGDLGLRRIVGQIVDADATSVPLAVVAPGPGVTPAAWLVDLPPGLDAADVADGLRQDVEGLAPLTRADAGGLSDNQAAAVLVLGGFALVEAALVVSASFAVSIRRRQRDLGLLAVGGASPRHLRASVWTSGLTVGVAGAVVGVTAGLAGVRLALPWIAGRADRVVTGLVVPPSSLVVPLLLGTATAVVAALVPARGAIRLPVAVALANRRPPSRPSRRWAVAGMLLVVSGVACVAVTSAVVATLPLPDAVRGLAVPGGVLLGSVLGVLGVGAASPWLLERLGRLAPRLPLGLRLAVRDTGRFRTRNGPVVTAVVAGLAGSIALGTVLGSMETRNRAAYVALMDTDQVLVAGPSSATVTQDVSRRLDAVAASPLRPLEGDDPESWVELHAPDGTWLSTVVGDPTTVRALGGDDDDVVALARGEVVVWTADTPDHVDLVDGRDGPPTAADTTSLPVHVAATANAIVLPDAVVSVQTLEEVGMAPPTGPASQGVVRLPGPIDAAGADAARAVAAGASATTVTVELGYVNGTATLRGAVQVAALLTALVVVAIALSLSAAESRSDRAAMIAIGAPPWVTRNLSAGRAAVLAGLGGLLSVPAGLLPAWGLVSTLDGMPFVPAWAAIGAAALGLPAIAVAGAWVLARSGMPNRVHRTA